MSGRIQVNGIGKAYKQYPTRWSRMAEWMLPFLGPRHSLKWVLQQIRFEVAPGEAVGLIGINGAGKSTLLKLITGTTQASTGSVHIGGRVAAMLELGMGFHPDFTGRQNVIMAGQLLGLSVPEILALMPEIEAFAAIGDYIDQQVRVYSSGMQVRLAFSLATARRPDVLIIDEALAVGDAYFQHKSFDRIRAFRALGTTLLIVSHDRAAIQSICDRAILLNQGTVAMEGRPDEVMDYYNALLGEKENDTVIRSAAAEGRSQTRSGTGEASVTDLWLEDADHRRLELVNVGTAVTLCARARAHADIARLVFGYAIKDRLGQDMYGTNTFHLDAVQNDVRRGEELTFRFAFPLNLGPGSYSVTTALTSSETHLSDNYEWRDLALLFIIVNMDRKIFVGTNWIEPTVEISR